MTGNLGNIEKVRAEEQMVGLEVDQNSGKNLSTTIKVNSGDVMTRLNSLALTVESDEKDIGALNPLWGAASCLQKPGKHSLLNPNWEVAAANLEGAKAVFARAAAAK